MINYDLIDKSFVNIIKRLNDNGYITTFSCSGMEADHPSEVHKDLLQGNISFLIKGFNEEQIIKIKSKAMQCGLKQEIYDDFIDVYLPVREIISIPDLKKEIHKMIFSIADKEYNILDEQCDSVCKIQDTLIEEIKEELGEAVPMSDFKKIEIWNNFVDQLLN